MVSETRVAVLATGGKDSTLALYHALNDGYDVACLATMLPLREDSWMFHYPNIGLVDLFSEAVGIPVTKAETQGIKDQEVDDLRRLIEELHVEGIVSGGIASNYQKTKIDEICRELRLRSISPLWGKDPMDILNEMLSLEFSTIIVGVYAYGFSEEWLGRRIDTKAIDDLKMLNKAYGVSLVGEGGEYETLVLDASFFKKRIAILAGHKVWKGQSGFFSITEARVESK